MDNDTIKIAACVVTTIALIIAGYFLANTNSSPSQTSSNDVKTADQLVFFLSFFQ
jgi:hypothetical protein